MSLWKVVRCFDFVTLIDGILVITEGSMLLRFFLLQWMIALSLWKVVCYLDFVTPLDGSLVIKKVVRSLDFVTPMDGSLVILEGSLLLRFCYFNGC